MAIPAGGAAADAGAHVHRRAALLLPLAAHDAQEQVAPPHADRRPGGGAGGARGAGRGGGGAAARVERGRPAEDAADGAAELPEHVDEARLEQGRLVPHPDGPPQPDPLDRRRQPADHRRARRDDGRNYGGADAARAHAADAHRDGGDHDRRPLDGLRHRDQLPPPRPLPGVGRRVRRRAQFGAIIAQFGAIRRISASRAPHPAPPPSTGTSCSTPGATCSTSPPNPIPTSSARCRGRTALSASSPR